MNIDAIIVYCIILCALQSDMVHSVCTIIFSRCHSSVSLKWFCSIFASAFTRAESGSSPGGGASIIVHVGAINAVWSFSASELSSWSLWVVGGWSLDCINNLNFKMLELKNNVIKQDDDEQYCCDGSRDIAHNYLIYLVF